MGGERRNVKQMTSKTASWTWRARDLPSTALLLYVAWQAPRAVTRVDVGWRRRSKTTRHGVLYVVVRAAVVAESVSSHGRTRMEEAGGISAERWASAAWTRWSGGGLIFAWTGRVGLGWLADGTVLPGSSSGPGGGGPGGTTGSSEVRRKQPQRQDTTRPADDDRAEPNLPRYSTRGGSAMCLWMGWDGQGEAKRGQKGQKGQTPAPRNGELCGKSTCDLCWLRRCCCCCCCCAVVRRAVQCSAGSCAVCVLSRSIHSAGGQESSDFFCATSEGK